MRELKKKGHRETSSRDMIAQRISIEILWNLEGATSTTPAQ